MFLKPNSLNNGPLGASKQYSKKRKAMHACKEEKYEKVVRNVLMNRRKHFVNGYIALSEKLVQMFMVRKIGKMIHSKEMRIKRTRVVSIQLPTIKLRFHFVFTHI